MNTNKDKLNHGVSRQLTGENNIRLHETTPVNNDYTQAIFNKAGEYPDSKVTIPTLAGVIDNKNWVDNGSKT